MITTGTLRMTNYISPKAIEIPKEQIVSWDIEEYEVKSIDLINGKITLKRKDIK